MLAVVTVLYLGICVAMFWTQRSLIYFPRPGARGDAGTMKFAAEDGTELIVTVRPHAGPQALLYFGGNAEDVAEGLPTFVAAFPQHALYLMNYRGYGGSSGQPSEAALFADALALFDRVRTEHEDVTVVGRSLGSGVAVQLASLRPVARLVLVTPFDSLQEIAAGQYPYLPVRWILSDKYQSWKYAARVTAPTLLIAAERDEIIPRKSTESLLARFPPGIATLKIVGGATHNNISEGPEYISYLSH